MRGAERVRAMYANVGRTMAPDGAVAILCSWRDPESEDGLAWVVDLVLGGLRRGAAQADAAGVAYWSLDVHTLVDQGARGPHVYIVRRRPRRRARRGARATGSASCRRRRSARGCQGAPRARARRGVRPRARPRRCSAAGCRRAARRTLHRGGRPAATRWAAGTPARLTRRRRAPAPSRGRRSARAR